MEAGEALKVQASDANELHVSSFYIRNRTKRGNNIMQTIKPEKIITTISNLKTGEVYKTEDEWKAKGRARNRD